MRLIVRTQRTPVQDLQDQAHHDRLSQWKDYTEAIIVWLVAEDHINIDVTNKMRKDTKKTAPGK